MAAGAFEVVVVVALEVVDAGALEVVVAGALDVVVAEALEVTRVVGGGIVADPEPSRYQFDLGSPRHSPTVTSS